MPKPPWLCPSVLPKRGPVQSVGDLANRSGLSVSAIHFYEKQGLIRSERNASNHRRFPRATLRLLAIIKVGQGAGIPLAKIRHALSPVLYGERVGDEEWVEISQAWRGDLNRRIGALERVRDRLTGCIRCGCLSLTMCAAVNPGDAAKSNGPGAKGLDADS